jgi:hypothetical protein
MHHGVYKAVNEFILKYNYELIYAMTKFTMVHQTK